MGEVAFEGSGGCEVDGDGSGYGSGDGYGYGYGDGDGYGYGYGYGSGYGDGDGYGSGSVYGSGDGYGYGYGSGYGDGYGDGYGSGDGYGYGSVYGYGDVYGSGYGDGDGDGSVYGNASEAYWAAICSVQAQRTGAIVALWKSASDGKPANGGHGGVLQPGDLQVIDGPLKLCTKNALHATWSPEKWKGDRLWVVALFGEIAVGEHKLGALKREIICELQQP